MKKVKLDNIVIDENVKDSQVAIDAKQRWAPLLTQDIASQDYSYKKGKRTLVINESRGEMVHECASASDQYLCCNVLVSPTVSNCPFDCSYCFLQDHLTDTLLSVNVDNDNIAESILERTSQEPNRLFRIGTWVLGDSLAIDPMAQSVIELAKILQARSENILLELKTKSANVELLLKENLQDMLIVSFSLNPESVISEDEKGTASLKERLDAMVKVTKVGYKIGIHFDPIIEISNFDNEYLNLIDQIFKLIKVEDIVWISLGSLRFSNKMKNQISLNYPKSKIIYEEFVKGSDNLLRYPKPVRIKQYRTVYNQLVKQSPNLPFIYLCMERYDLWERVFESKVAVDMNEVDYFIALSIYNRIAKLVKIKPERCHYR